MKIHLNIDELILHGFSINEAANLDKFIREELTDLIKKEGLPSNLRAGEKRSLQSVSKLFDASHNTNYSRSLGTHIAQSIYRSMTARD